MGRNERGISMMILVISIIVILIISGIGINVGIRMINDTNRQNIKTNMLLIKGKARLAEENVEFKTSNKTNEIEIQEIKDEEYFGIKLKDVDNEKVKNQINMLIDNGILPNPETNNDEFSKYYYINQDNLNGIGLGEIKESDGAYYFVKYEEENVDIIYTKGFTDLDGNTFYALTQMK